MLVFWEARLVLLAVPKTGTQALASALAPRADIAIRNPSRLKHMPLGWFRRALLPILENAGGEALETAAVIREPLDWLASWYRYRRRPEIAGRPASTATMDFAEFAEGWLADPQPPFARVGRQARFLKAEGARVDHIFAYERPDALHAFLAERLGERIALPRINVSPPAETALPPALQSRLEAELGPDRTLHRKALETEHG